MNKVILMGRLTRDPEVRYSSGDSSMAIARYTLAVDRRFRRNGDGEQTADFIGCVAYGKSAEFAERYFRQGLKIVVKMVRRSTPQMWLWKIRSLQRAKLLPCQMAEAADMNRQPRRRQGRLPVRRQGMDL